MGKEVKGPSERGGGRFVSGEEEHADLVGDFLVGESVVCDGVDGFHEAGEDVLWLGRSGACLFEAFCDDF